MKKFFRKFTTVITVLALVVTLVPMTAMAQDNSTTSTTLESLTTTEGELSPAFSSGTYYYTIALGADKASTDLTAIASSTLSTINSTGADRQTVTVSLDPGEDDYYQFTVHSQSGDQWTYTVHVTRAQANDANLATLTATEGTWNPTPFAPDTTNYVLTLAKGTASTVLHATASNAAYATVKVGEGETPATWDTFNNTTGKTVALNNGENKIIKFQVTAQDATVKVYTINVTRAEYATLRITTVDNIGDIWTGVGVAVYDNEACAGTPEGSGTTDSSGIYTLSGLDTGSYWVKVTAVPAGYELPTVKKQVTATEGQILNHSVMVDKKKIYTYAANQLRDIQFTGTGSLNRLFEPTYRTYTLTIDENQSQTTITPVLAVPNSTTSIYFGSTKVATKSFTLSKPGSSTKVYIKVRPATGSSLTYTLYIKRGKSTNADLSNLTFNYGSLDSAFNKDDTSYIFTLPNTISSFRITPTLAGYGAKYSITSNGLRSNTTITLSPDQEKTVIITVKAQNGNTKAYTLTARRPASKNASLKKLTVTLGSVALPLSPAFNKDTLKYTLQLTTTQGSLTLGPELEDATAKYTMTADGTTTTNKTITVNPGKSKKVVIKVTAQDLTTVKEYEIQVNRDISDNADLRSVAASVGTLSQTFNKDVQMYALSVPYSQATVKLTITKDDTTASFSSLIIGATSTGTNSVTSSLAATLSLSLTPGQVKYVIITVRAQNGDLKDYIFRIVRAAS